MNEHDDLTTTLTRELHEQVDGMGSSLGFSAVQGRARSIRRRRAATVVAGAVAAVAIAIPGLTLLVGDTGGHHVTPAPATNTPSPAPTQTPSADGLQPAAGVLDVSDLPTGPPPATGYVVDGTWHSADGSESDVATRYPPDSLVEMNDGSRVWQTVNDGTPYIEIQDADGGFHDPVRSGWGLSVNHSHTVVAWLAPSGQVIMWEARATDPRPLGERVPGSELRLGPVMGEGVGAGGGSGPGCAGGGCTVYVNVAGNPGQVWEVSDAGTHQLRDGGYLTLTDLDPSGLSIGLTRLTDLGSCSKLLGGGEFQGFETCKNQLSSFSPDGRLILAEPAYSDGLGAGAIAMYDLGGHRLFQRSSTEQAQAYYPDATWEDDTHLLAPIFQDGKWALVRIASDGSMEYAVAPAKGPYEKSPFILPKGSPL